MGTCDCRSSWWMAATTCRGAAPCRERGLNPRVLVSPHAVFIPSRSCATASAYSFVRPQHLSTLSSHHPSPPITYGNGSGRTLLLNLLGCWGMVPYMCHRNP